MIRNLRELYQYRALLWSLTLRELRARYRASVLGFLWTFLNPTLNMAVYFVVFGYLLKSPVENYPYHLFVGLLPWICFASSITGGVSAVTDRRDLLTKVRFPAQVLPATVVLTNLANFVLSLPLLMGMGLVLKVWPTWHYLFFVPVVLLQTFFTLSLTYMLSSLNVAFRDLQHVIGNVVQMWFFLTPVLWPLEQAPDKWREWVLYGNPMAAMLHAYRAIFLNHTTPELRPLAWVAVLSLAMFIVAANVFERRREDFAELV